MLPIDAPFPRVLNSPTNMEEGVGGEEIVVQDPRVLPMEIEEIPRERKRRKSTESLGSGTSIEEMRALIKTELNLAMENSMWEPSSEPVDQLRHLQCQQKEMCATADKVIQDMKNAWATCQKVQLELQNQMNSRMNFSKQNTEHQQSVTEYALRHLDSNVANQGQVMEEMRQNQAKQNESLHYLNMHPALSSPVATPTLGPPPIPGLISSPVTSTTPMINQGTDREDPTLPVRDDQPNMRGNVAEARNGVSHNDPCFRCGSSDPMRGTGLGPMRGRIGNEGNAKDFIPNVKIAPIPTFDSLKYNHWRREFLFWRQLHLFVPETQIISFIGLNGGSILRSHVMRLFRNTDLRPERRSFAELLSVLDGQYAVSAQERDMEEMDKLFELRREKHESIQEFWAKFDVLISHLEGSAAMLSDSLLFIRALRSLNINAQQRMSLIGLMDCRALPHSLQNLRTCSLQFFGVYSSLKTKEERTWMTGELGYDDDNNQEADGGIDTLVLKKGKKNRPGMEGQALKKTNDMVNLRNEVMVAEKKIGKCFRCGSADHMLRQCPVPFTPVLAFAPNATNSGKGQGRDNRGKGVGKNSRVLFQEDMSALNSEDSSSSNHMPVTEEDIVEDNQTHGAEEVDSETAYLWDEEWMTEINTIMTCDVLSTEIDQQINLKTVSHSLKLPELIIDCGAASTVVGLTWLKRWRKWGEQTEALMLAKSTKQFRFGNNCLYPSMGSITLHGWIWTGISDQTKKKQDVSFLVDVIALDVPLLLSLQSLKLMQCKIDFGQSILVWPSGLPTNLTHTSNQHLSFEWYPHLCADKMAEHIYMTEEESVLAPLSRTQLIRMHVQLGHADFPAMIQLLKRAGQQVDEPLIREIILNCGCERSSDRPQRPRISKYVAKNPGEVIEMDIFYPAGIQTKPSVITICSFSRLVMARFIPNLQPRTLVSFLLLSWSVLMGMPKYVLTDRGTPFSGEYWNQMNEIYGTIVIQAPTKAAYQIGGVERIGSLIKDIFTAGWKVNDIGWTHQEVLSMACLAKNSTPHTTLGLSPLHVVTGRADNLEFLINQDHSTMNLDSEPAQNMWDRINALHCMRDQLATKQAQKILRMIDSSQMRAHAADIFRHNDTVQQWNPLEKKWHGAFRCIFDSGRNVYIERGNSIQKVPRQWVRVRGGDQSLLLPEKLPVEISNRVSTARSSPTPLNRLVPVPLTREEGVSHEPSSSSADPNPPTPLVPNTSTNNGESKEGNVESLRMKRMLTTAPVGVSGAKRVDFIPWKKYHLRSSEQELWNSVVYACRVNGKSSEDAFKNESNRKQDFVDSKGEASFEDMQQTLLDQFGIIDLSRLPPKAYLQLSVGRESIRDELNGLTACDKQGIPVGTLIELRGSDKKWRYPLVHTTMVTKIKANGKVKSRLCLRGDRIAQVNKQFPSAPTVSKEFIRIFCSIFVNHRSFVWMQVDISKAFTQSDLLHDSDKMIALLPSFIVSNGLPWQGWIATANDLKEVEGRARSTKEHREIPPLTIRKNDESFCKLGLLMHRPLYGSHDAPLRWYITISKLMITMGYAVLHVDKCVFAKHCSIKEGEPIEGFSCHQKKIRAIVLVHVDDIIFLGSVEERTLFQHGIDSLVHGEYEHLTENSPVVFCGMSISIDHKRVLTLSQKEFYSRIVPFEMHEVLEKGKIIIAPKDLQRKIKAIIGCCLWILHTRFDVTFGVCQMASLAIDAISCPLKLREFANLSKKVVDRIKLQHCPLIFHPLMMSIQNKTPQIIAFSDASFGTLRNFSSIAAFVLTISIPIQRNGAILCKGNVLGYFGRKINRVARSTAHAEGLALANAADTTLYFQVLLEEVFSGKFCSQFLRSTEEIVPLISPFRVVDEQSMTKAGFQIPTNEKLMQPCNYLSIGNVNDEACSFFSSTCGNCQKVGSMHCVDILNSYGFVSTKNTVDYTRPALFALLLCDCANTVALLSRPNANPPEKSYKVVCAYLYDSQKFINFSFANAPYNLADVGTKMASNVTIWRSFMRYGTFYIGFMSRREFKQTSEKMNLSRQQMEVRRHE